MIVALWLSLGLAGPGTAFVVSKDGARIAYSETGRGEPAVVLVHCWTCDRREWDAQLPLLARKRRVVALDLAGHGESGKERAAWTIEAFGDDVVAVVEALKLERVVLVGHSMGGYVSLAAAAQLGDRVVGLVPVDTLLDFEERMPADQIAAYADKFEQDYAAVAEAFVREYLFAPSSPPAVIEAVVARARGAPKAMAIGALRATWSYDAAEAADRLRLPIQAVNGDRYPTNLEANRRHARSYAATIMKGVGHYPMLEDPDRFGTLLEAAIAAVLGQAAQR